MAKTSDVSFIEQHIEKMVLAVAAVFLLFAVFKWGISTPARVELESEQVIPQEVDQKLQDVSDRILVTASRVKPEPLGEVPDFPSMIAQLRNDPVNDSLRVAPMGAPRVAKITPGEGISAQAGGVILLADLAQAMPAPTKINVGGVRELLDRINNPDTLATHGIVDYPVAELLKNWREKLQTTAISADLAAIVAKVDVQRREIRPDGTMSEPQTITQTVFSGYENAPVQPVQIPEYTGEETREIVRDAVAELASPLEQEDILRPQYWPVWAPEEKKWVTWKYKMPWTEREMPAITPSAAAADTAAAERQAELERRRQEYIERQKAATEARRARQRTATGTGGRGAPGAMPGGMPDMPGMMPDMMAPTPAPAARTTRTPAARTTERTTAAARTPQPGAAMPPDMMMPGMMDPGMMMPGRPTDRTRTPSAALGRRELSEEAFDTETIHLWFHDGNVEVQKRYIYRVRLYFVNPLLTYDREVSKENPQDAKVATVETPWSPWSKPIIIPRSTEFFVTSVMEPKEEFTCTIFAQSLGQWVRERFKIQAGNPIGGIVRKTVINPATGEQTEQDVNFTTGAVAVELDFKKRILSGTGITKRTYELVYVEGDNLLSQVRVTDLDRKDALRQKYDEFQKLVKAAEDAAQNTGRQPAPARGAAPQPGFPF